jgi:hypothetical protein
VLPAEWGPAVSLRLPGVDIGSAVARRETAARFQERVRALREIQVRKKLGRLKDSRILKYL